jgi:uncharacterized protein (TIGR02246 family)
MRKPVLLALCPLLLLAAAARAQTPAKDERAIREFAARWQENWNHHDVKALSGLLTDDADFVTGSGDWLRGRAEFEDWVAHRGQPDFNDSVWANDQVGLRFLMPDIAIVHITWQIRGGSKPSRGITTWVLIRAGGKWWIRAAQETYSP